MIFAGTEQARVAADMLTLTGAVLTGPITAIEYRANLAARTGAPAAMGISMAAGSVAGACMAWLLGLPRPGGLRKMDARLRSVRCTPQAPTGANG